MLRSRIALVAWVATLGAPAQVSGQSTGLSIDTALARQYFREAAELTAHDGGRLWGRPVAGPLLFADPVTRCLLAEVPDPEGQLHALGGFYTGTLPASEPVANTGVRWAGRTWAMVRWPPTEDSVERGVLLVHELWHRIQDSIGLPGRDPPNGHLATRDGRLWLRLEGRALARALDGQGAARLRALRDAILFRRYRRQRLAAADSTERQLELNEGLAEYTGVTLAAGTPELRRDLVARRLAILDTASHLERSFAYQTGPAYGFFLDELAPDWRTTLHPGDDLAYRLGEAIRARDRISIALTRASPYGYTAVRRAEIARAARDRARIAALRSRFVTGPLLELPLAEMKLGFDPNAVQSLDSLGSVYGSLRLSDRWGVLQTDGSGGLISSDWRRLVIPAPGDTAGRRLVGPGWVLELAPGWKLIPGRRARDWTLERP